MYCLRNSDTCSTIRVICNYGVIVGVCVCVCVCVQYISGTGTRTKINVCIISCLTTRLNKIVVTLQDISLRLLVSENSKSLGVPYATLSAHSYSSGMRTDCTCTVVHLFRCSFPPLSPVLVPPAAFNPAKVLHESNERQLQETPTYRAFLIRRSPVV
jgi:hypothetical protein